jgi:Na+-driven multidrug efflux pump
LQLNDSSCSKVFAKKLVKKRSVPMNSASRTIVTMVTAAGLTLSSVGLAAAQDWPQWRGPGRDNKVTGFTAPAAWPKELTKKWETSR